MYCTIEEYLPLIGKARLEILTRLLEQSLELVSVFKEASRNFIFIYSLTRQHKN
jgi:hypothetical protein